jgi:hypothetical protein
MIRFRGNVGSGIGKHAQMTIPGRLEMASPPEGWPDQFHPGSLNVGIPRDGYPNGFRDPDDGGIGVVALDEGSPAPCLVLPWDKIANNGLKPKPGKPRRGTGQFWRARLTVVSTGQTADCWVFRRIDSTIKRQLEVMSESRLRSTLSLKDGAEVFVDLLQDDETDRTRQVKTCNQRSQTTRPAPSR